MQMSATARLELEIERVMKQQHSIAANIRRIEGNSTDGIARSPEEKGFRGSALFVLLTILQGDPQMLQQKLSRINTVRICYI